MRWFSRKTSEPKKFDPWLIGIIFLLIATSFLAIYSSMKLVPAAAGNPVFNQLKWVIVGLVAVIVITYFDNEALYDFIKIVYWILMGLLLILFIDLVLFKLIGRHLPGGLITDINGAISWYQIPGIGSFQPSEFMKIVLIVRCALVIDEHNQDKIEDCFESDIELFGKIIRIIGFPLLLILLQPDTGIFIIIVFSIAMMVLCSGIKKEWFVFALILVLVFLTLFMFLFFFQRDFLEMFIDSYKLQRIDGWLFPELNKNGDGYQLYTALLAIGSAGLNGVGLQPNTIVIAEAHTDLIFVVFAQSFGFIGAIWIIFLCFGLDFRISTILRRTKNMSEKYMLCGFIGMLIYQQIQNIGMVVGLLPITGITLPFISYGGSSLLSYFIMLGFVLNASAHANKPGELNYD